MGVKCFKINPTFIICNFTEKQSAFYWQAVEMLMVIFFSILFVLIIIIVNIFFFIFQMAKNETFFNFLGDNNLIFSSTLVLIKKIAHEYFGFKSSQLL